MKDLSDKYSKGKIKLKFLLVTPAVSSIIRKVLYSISVLILLSVTILLPLYQFSINSSLNAIVIVCLIVSMWILSYYLLKTYLNKAYATGMIVFNEESLDIKHNHSSGMFTISYSDIIRINHCSNIEGSIYNRSYYGFKTYIVEFVLYSTDNIVLEIEGNIYLTAEDKKQFHAIEPHLVDVLEHTKALQGVHRVDKLNTPLTLFDETNEPIFTQKTM